MTVYVQRRMVFDNQCDCQVDESVLEQAMLWIAERPQCSKKRIFMFGKYPAVSIHGKKYHIHRLVKMYLEKHLIASSIVVHHKDDNRLNAMPYNLEMLTDKEHGSHHNAGKTLSDDHRRKIGLAGRRRKGIKMTKSVRIDLDELKEKLASGTSINKCAKHFNCDWSTIKRRIHENPELLEL